MINRPLSEVLGIKKNQFQETRVRDQLPTQQPPPPLPEATSRSPASGHQFLAKVNLAEFPTSGRTLQTPLIPGSHDFDFSRDNTMLDERSRVRELEKQRERDKLQVRAHSQPDAQVCGTAGQGAEGQSRRLLLRGGLCLYGQRGCGG